MSVIDDLLKQVNIDELVDNLPKDEIQNYINDFLQKKGILVDSVDLQNEIERVKKRKELEKQNKKFRIAIGVTAILFVGGFSFLWYITQKNKK